MIKSTAIIDFNRINTFLSVSPLPKRHDFLLKVQNIFSMKILPMDISASKHLCSTSNCDSNSTNTSESVSKIPTAGIIIIGDEILKGQTQDVNTHFLTSQLYHLGIKVQKVSVIPDDLGTIAEEVSSFSKKYTHVITSGGIGPTHDDMTFEGVAAAFNEKLHPHPVIAKLIKDWFKTSDMNSPAMKMAQIPENSVLHFGEDKESGIKSRYPIVTVRNVTIFPGVPHLLRKAFDILGEKLFGFKGSGFFHCKIYFICDEVSLAAKLNQTVNKFPEVTFGSYPELFHSYYKTKVTMESLDKIKLEEAEAFLRSQFDEDVIVRYISDPISDPWIHMERLSPPIFSMFSEAMNVFSKCFEKYNPEEICLCYNGGKDCLVALHMTHLYMMKHYPNHQINAVYITEKNAFPQVSEFVNQSINRYNLDCEIIPGPMKHALSTLLEKRPAVKAVIMGTRRIDPHGDTLEYFTPTDDDWPPMMRVNPILDWEYNHVWSFIRQLCLPYCSLYDRGYTSLGSLDNTLPNPALETKDFFGRVVFLPAYQLKDQDLERKGRLY